MFNEVCCKQDIAFTNKKIIFNKYVKQRTAHVGKYIQKHLH